MRSLPCTCCFSVTGCLFVCLLLLNLVNNETHGCVSVNLGLECGLWTKDFMWLGTAEKHSPSWGAAAQICQIQISRCKMMSQWLEVQGAEKHRSDHLIKYSTYGPLRNVIKGIIPVFECIPLEKYVVNSLRDVGMVMSSICLCVCCWVRKGWGEKKEVCVWTQKSCTSTSRLKRELYCSAATRYNRTLYCWLLENDLHGLPLNYSTDTRWASTRESPATGSGCTKKEKFSSGSLLLRLEMQLKPSGQENDAVDKSGHGSHARQ